MRFAPQEDFEDEATGTMLCVGLTYTVKPGNDALAAKVRKWVNEGKVVVVPENDARNAKASVRGAGVVT